MLTPPSSTSKSRFQDHVPETHFGSQSRKTDGPVPGNIIFHSPSTDEACRTHGVADLLAMPLATPPLSPTRAVLIHPAHSRHNPQATIQDLSPELVENIISRLDNKALEAVVTTSRYYSAVAFREIMHRSQLLQPDVSLFMRSEFGALPHLFRVSRCPKGRIGATFMLNRSETDRQMQLLERYFLRLPLGTPLRRIDLQILTSAGALPLAQLLHSIGRITCEHMDIEVHEAPDDAEKDVAVLTVPTVPQLNSLSINGRVFFMQPVYNWTRQALILGSLHSLDLCAAGLPADEWKALLEWTTLPQLKYFTFVGTVPPAVLRDFLDRHPIIRDLTLGQVSAPSHGVELRPRIPKLLGVQTLSVNATYLSHLLNGTNAPRLRTLTIVLQKPGAAKALASLSLLAHCPTLYSIEFEISSSGAGLMKQVMEGLAVRSTLMHTVHRLELTSACSSTELHGDLYRTVKDLLPHFPSVTVLCFNEIGVNKEKGMLRLHMLETVFAASSQLSEVVLKVSNHEIKLTRTTRTLRDYRARPSVFEEM